MLICEKCGLDNPLGRIFCSGCGAKLNLAGMSAEDVAARLKAGRRGSGMGRVVAILFALVLVGAGLALWPRSVVVGQNGVAELGRRMEYRLAALDRMAEGQVSEITLSEREINGFLERCRAERPSLAYMGVECRPGSMRVGMVRSFGTFKVRGLDVTPKLTVNADYCSAGNRLAVRQAVVGHLPLPLWSRALATRLFLGAVCQEKALEIIPHLTGVRVEDGEMVLTFRK